MISRGRNFFLGLLLIVLTFFAFSKGHENNNNVEHMKLKANFNRVDGVYVGSDIRISGIKVGEVLNIELVKNKPTLYFNIEKNIIIPDDSSISIQTDGLFGSKYLTIEPGGSSKNLDKNGQINYTEDSILIEDLLNKIIYIGQTKKTGDEYEKKLF
ncbi:MlaD family protein [Rickettsiales bacterium]|nr:MlaD family protein [Rickettsiales bacterium]